MSGAGLKLLICLATFVCGQDEPNQTVASLTPSAEQSVSQTLQHQIRSLQLSAMDPNAALQTNMLKSMIDQIQSLSIPPEKVQNAAPAQPASKTPAASMGPKISSPQTETPSSTASLDGIDAMAAPLNPLAAADALYRMGDYSRAVRFYEKAVGQGTDSDVSVRQWAMYQTANCMSRLDAGQAVSMYAKLLADYPSNPWAAAAMAQKRSLEWLAENHKELNLRTDANVSKP